MFGRLNPLSGHRCVQAAASGRKGRSRYKKYRNNGFFMADSGLIGAHFDATSIP
jgi:hypothetical protein